MSVGRVVEEDHGRVLRSEQKTVYEVGVRLEVRHVDLGLDQDLRPDPRPRP